MPMNTDSTTDAAAEIRPGVFRPDWSAVTAPAAIAALRTRAARRSRLLEKWSRPLEQETDLVWRSALQLYVEFGRAPEVVELANETKLAPEAIWEHLAILHEHDLLGWDASHSALRFAYPFTEAQTGHRILLTGQRLNALCAVDALGAGAMYQCDTTIESACRHCGEKIRLTTSGQGTTLRSASPADTVVWYDSDYSVSAATSCCRAIAFFCSAAHRQTWLDVQIPSRRGVELSAAEALEVGRAIFGPVLVPPVGSGQRTGAASTTA